MKQLHEILTLLDVSVPVGTIMVTLVGVEGSSYRRPGARMLLSSEGRRTGSISGGCLEDDVIAHARGVQGSGRAKVITYDTTSENDLVWGVGLGCHGVVHLLIEELPPRPVWAEVLRENLRKRVPTELAVVWQGPEGTRLGTSLAGNVRPEPGLTVFRQTVLPPTPLVVFGAGDDARPLVRFAKELGWQVNVVDARPAFATPARFPEADGTVVARPEEAVARINPEADSVVIVMTHHYHHDVPLLRALLPRPLAYLGLLGPRKRAERILSDLTADGFTVTPDMRERLHAPVGLDLGAETPEAVALSILAEMQAVLARRDARPLRERQRPIHTE
jgi:xanthine/CO dehydrogenase XdhC/CoxF family maturation factor